MVYKTCTPEFLLILFNKPLICTGFWWTCPLVGCSLHLPFLWEWPKVWAGPCVPLPLSPYWHNFFLLTWALSRYGSLVCLLLARPCSRFKLWCDCEVACCVHVVWLKCTATCRALWRWPQVWDILLVHPLEAFSMMLVNLYLYVDFCWYLQWDPFAYTGWWFPTAFQWCRWYCSSVCSSHNGFNEAHKWVHDLACASN